MQFENSRFLLNKRRRPSHRQKKLIQKMKIKEINRANVAVASNKPKRNRVSLECIARVCAVVTFFAVLPAHHALADADDKALAADRQSIQQQLNALKAQVASLQGSDTPLTSQVSGL